MPDHLNPLGEEVHEVDLDCAGAWCEEKIRAGAVVDPKVFAALYFLLR